MWSNTFSAPDGTVDGQWTWVANGSESDVLEASIEDVTGASQTSAITAGDIIKDTTTETFYRFIGSNTSSWVIPSTSSADWQEIAKSYSASVITSASGDILIEAIEQVDFDADLEMRAVQVSSSDWGMSMVADVLESVINSYRYSTNSGVQEVVLGEIVYVASDYAGGGTPERMYRYVGAIANGQVFNVLDLDAQDYSDLTNWLPVITYEDVVGTISDWVNIGPGSSESTAVGVTVSLNTMHGKTRAYSDGVDLTATTGDITVYADELADFRANMTVEVTSSGGGLVEKGSSLAIGVTISTNQVDTSSIAYINDAAVSAGGDVVVTAEGNTSMDADLDAFIKSNGVSVGITLAFNSMGFGSNNILFNVIDTLIPNDPTSSNNSLTAGTDADKIATRAYISNSSVKAGDDIEIRAEANNSLDADIVNAAVSIAVTLSDDQDSVSVGAVLALNRMQYDTQAYAYHNSLMHAGFGQSSGTDHGIVVSATDNSYVDAVVFAPALRGLSAHHLQGLSRF